MDGFRDRFGRIGEARAGRATLKRGILLDTLARAEGGQRPGLLELALRIPDKLVAGGLRGTFYQREPAAVVGAQAVAADTIARMMPALRAELDRLDLKRVRLVHEAAGRNWQGQFRVTGDGAMEIAIGASLDPAATLRHEVIHALRAMNLFTPQEWRALSLKAERSWLAEHDIARRYPELPPETQIEEAIAEAFSAALRTKTSPRGSALVTAFNKIARFLRALRNVLEGAGFRTAEDVFGDVVAGRISARLRDEAAPGLWQQRQPITPLARAAASSALGSVPHAPDPLAWGALHEQSERPFGGIAGCFACKASKVVRIGQCGATAEWLVDHVATELATVQLRGACVRVAAGEMVTSLAGLAAA